MVTSSDKFRWAHLTRDVCEGNSEDSAMGGKLKGPWISEEERRRIAVPGLVRGGGKACDGRKRVNLHVGPEDNLHQCQNARVCGDVAIEKRLLWRELILPPILPPLHPADTRLAAVWVKRSTHCQPRYTTVWVEHKWYLCASLRILIGQVLRSG